MDERYSNFKVLPLMVGLIITACLASRTNAQVKQVELMAADISWTNSSYTGYAFMCLTTGASEECYGFYPKPGNKGFIGGPGVAQPQFQKTPQRFSALSVSIRKQITTAQRQKIMHVNAKA
jgi:hypothetical protein